MDITVPNVHGNTLAQQIRIALSERILDGKLAPGTRLKDNEVAELFGTSNTPVREALREMAKEGLVEILPYRGCVVRSVSLEEMAEAFEVRGALEALAARLGADRLRAEQLGMLESLVDRYEAAMARRDGKLAMEVGRDFHQRMVDACGNGLLSRTLQQIRTRTRLVRRISNVDVVLPEDPSHRSILEALQARDGERAATLITRHHLRCREWVVDLLQRKGIERV